MNFIDTNTNTNIMVKKSQLMVRESRYKLSEVAMKSLSLLIAQIHENDEEFKQYSLEIKELMSITGSKSKNVDHYIDVLTNELMSNPFWVGTSKFNWVTVADYRTNEGYVHFEIHQRLKPFLLELKKDYLTYEISNVMHLKSPYVIRLYELCKDHFNAKKDKSIYKNGVFFEMKISEFRELFGIPNTYQYSSGIKLRILNKAMLQFAEKTDIKISYEEKKKGNKVESVIITVNSNLKGSADINKVRNKFISHIRSQYVNQLLLEGKDKNTNIPMKISVSEKGKLYDMNTAEDFKAIRSDEIWDSLFKMSKEGTLKCLTANTLDL